MPMRILWFTNWPMPEMSVELGLNPSPREGWMPALAKELVCCDEISLGVVTTVVEPKWDYKNISGIHYYAIPSPKENLNRGFLPNKLISNYQKVVNDFCPNVIHIHGTEYFHGLLTGRGYINCPTILSIQGIIDVCKKYYLGGMSLKEVFSSRTLRDWIRLDGLIEQKYKWGKRAKWEKEVFEKNNYFMGQTLWDKAHLKRLNPNAKYFRHSRILHDIFYDTNWNLSKINRYSIFASSALYPLKGFHVLIKAVGLLHSEFPNIQLNATLAHFFPEMKGISLIWKNLRSVGYFKYLTNLIIENDLEEHINKFFSLDAYDMASQYSSSHIFALPSFIENESISLAEAMMVGTPSVSAYIGGVPSMAKDNESVLFFPPGDESVLAEQIRRIFLSDELACELSKNAKAISKQRHMKKKIVNDVINIYKEVAI